MCLIYFIHNFFWTLLSQKYGIQNQQIIKCGKINRDNTKHDTEIITFKIKNYCETQQAWLNKNGKLGWNNLKKVKNQRIIN